MSAEDIRKAYVEELLKKIVSIDSMANIIFLSNYVDAILREENAVNYRNDLDDRLFKIKMFSDNAYKETMPMLREESYMDLEYKFNKQKKKRFGR